MKGALTLLLQPSAELKQQQKAMAPVQTCFTAQEQSGTESWAAPSLFPTAELRRIYSAALNIREYLHDDSKQKTNHVPKNLSARLLDCRASAVRKPLLSDGMMVD